jgi:hypothetical protein
MISLLRICQRILGIGYPQLSPRGDVADSRSILIYVVEARSTHVAGWRLRWGGKRRQSIELLLRILMTEPITPVTVQTRILKKLSLSGLRSKPLAE